ncbi:MAG: hypothetical protein LBU40_01680 [Methanobrevibacter sp.]|jgi:hypothetical protein|nr:hypothetical protein [Methanobrevibacter sp.]
MFNQLKKSSITIMENVLGGIILVIVPFYSWIYSTVNKISFHEFLINIPLTIWIFILLIFILWCIVKFIRREMKKGIVEVFVVNNEYEKIGNFYYKDILWDIEILDRKYRFSPWAVGFDVSDSEKKREILQFMRIGHCKCPICKTELEFNDNFLYYTYSCVDETCTFKKVRSWKNIGRLKAIVKKLVKRDIELNKLTRS